MLFDLHKLVKKYNIHFQGILHVGAHLCEELPVYETYLPRNGIVWIDALPEKVAESKERYPGIQILKIGRAHV